MKIFLTYLIILAGLVTHAQDKAQFGYITLEDFNGVYKAKAPAAVMFDRGLTKFRTNDDMYIEYTRETRIHIHDKSGFGFAEIAIPYYQDGYGKMEVITDIEAYSYTINRDQGKIDKISISMRDVYEEDVNERWKLKKFVFPNVREGSIIEYKYVKRSPFLSNPPDWEFQWGIPVKHSQYEIHLTPFYEYSFLLQGASRFDGYTSFKSDYTDAYANVKYNLMVHRYTMNDLPAFTDESFITSRSDYITKMDFQLAKIHYPSGATKNIMTSWEEISKEYMDMDGFGKYIKQCRKLAADILKGHPELLSDENPTRNIVKYVRRNFEWNGIRRDFSMVKARDFLSNGTGTSGEMNLLLLAMLQEAGLTAEPVLLSTRDHGKIHRKYPFNHYFNDVIVAVSIQDGILLVDATESNLPYDRLPLRCLNEIGLIVDEETERWVSLETNNRAIENFYIESAIDPETQRMHSKAMGRLTGYAAYAARRSVFDNIVELSDSRLSLGMDDVGNVTFENVRDPERAYQVRYEGNRSLEAYDDKILIQPFDGLVDNETPFKETSRQYPVDMLYPTTSNYVINIEIPDGYGVSELPESIQKDNELLKAVLEVKELNNKIQINGEISFKSAVYPAKQYRLLRSHYGQVLDAFTQMIVLSKTE